MSIKVSLLCDFRADARVSMDVYAHGLASALQAIPDQIIQLHEFIPQKPAWMNSRWGMRFARFLLYPGQIPTDDFDIYHIIDHGYGHLLHSIKNKKKIVTVHDLIPLLLWKGIIPSPRSNIPPFLNLYSFHALKEASHIIAVSENTKKDLIRWIGCDSNQITVIYSGIDSIFHPLGNQFSKEMISKKFGIDLQKKTILIPGSQFYKNNETSLAVLSQLKIRFKNQIQIVKIGYSTPKWTDLVDKYHLENDVHDLGVISRDLLPDLYRAVNILLFPSLYEGFGWPPLEAMACGTPVITSFAASLPEIIGGKIPMFEPRDVEGITEEIIHILQDEDYRDYLIEIGIDRASKFKWTETARKTIEVYQKVLAK